MAEPEFKRWYKTSRWQKLRARQLRLEPLCRMCKPRATPATVCDHVERHRGDPVKFWAGPFQSLCKPCHDRDKQTIERGGVVKVPVGNDGWPAS
jgi:5-methylcytosine-specific restriction protein A